MDIWIKNATINNVNISIRRTDSDKEQILQLKKIDFESTPPKNEESPLFEKRYNNEEKKSFPSTEPQEKEVEPSPSSPEKVFIPEVVEEVSPAEPPAVEVPLVEEPVVKPLEEILEKEPKEEVLEDSPHITVIETPEVHRVKEIKKETEIFVDYVNPPIFSRIPPDVVHEIIKQDMEESFQIIDEIPEDSPPRKNKIPAFTRFSEDVIVHEPVPADPPTIDVDFQEVKEEVSPLKKEDIKAEPPVESPPQVQPEPAEDISPEEPQPQIPAEDHVETEPEEIINNVRFRNPKSDLFITWDENTKTVVMDKRRDGDPAQAWSLIQVDGDGESPIPRFIIKNALTEKCLVFNDFDNPAAEKRGTYKNRDLITAEDNSNLEFQWIFVPIPPNTSTDNVLIINNKSKLVCDIYLHQVVPGTKLVQYSFRGGSNQLFTLEKI